MFFLRLLQSVSNPGLGKSGWEAGGQYIYILMFLIFSKCVRVFIFTVIAHKDMFNTVIFGVPWQQEAFYHQPIDTTWWVIAPPPLPPLFAPDWKALGCLSLTGKKNEEKGRSQIISSAPELSLFLLKCGSLVPTRVRVRTCLLRSVPMAELSQRSIYFAGFLLRSATVLWSVVVWAWRCIMWSSLLEITA